MRAEAHWNKIAVVTGGAGGIGRAVVLRLTEAAFLPIILDQDESSGQQLLLELLNRGKKGDFIALNLTRKTEVQDALGKVVSHYGRVDALVNLAGGTLHAKLIQDFPLKEWQEVIDLNLKATFLCCQAIIGIMKKQRSGVIVNTSSNFGITGSPTRTAYSAAKAAVIAFTKSLALELAPYGIRVNAVAPGLTATQRVMNLFSHDAWLEEEKKIPMGRSAMPREIAEGVAFLASEESAFITGQTFHVNGGMVLP
jgi:3-oxoacyl-[acyl-carrier protein] reductase